MKNEIWHTLKDAKVGDAVTLFLEVRSSQSDLPDRLVKGVVTKVTPATRQFTTDGATHDGSVKLGARQYSETIESGFAAIDGVQYRFRPATSAKIAWLTNPHKQTWEIFNDAMRDVIRFYGGERALTKDKIGKIVAELENALVAGRAAAVIADDA